MITVKTSYYAKIARRVNPSSKLAIISNTHPSWFKQDCVNVKEVAPRWSDIEAYTNGDMSFEIFKEKYYEYLMDKFGTIDEIRNYILDVLKPEEGDEIIFLCWEKDGNRCHRSAFAELVFNDEYKGELE